MTLKTTYAAEVWETAYTALENISFASFDMDSIISSVAVYLKEYHPEDFNDFIASSEFMALVRAYAYVAEQLAYRIDITAHENFLSTAQRKQSVLRLAKLLSYSASRNIPGRGLVKITSVRTSEVIYDSMNNNLSNVSIYWNDRNNQNWREQFFLVMSSMISSNINTPIKSVSIGDTTFSSYALTNYPEDLIDGVFKYSVSNGDVSLPMELVSVDIDSNIGPFERPPSSNDNLTILLSSDTKGDGSPYAGFMMLTKQGTLSKFDHTITTSTPNRRIEYNTINVNDTDVWVFSVDDNGLITKEWHQVDAVIDDQNLYFNSSATRDLFQVETLEGDKVAILFGDGDFSSIPMGNIQVWFRASTNDSYTLQTSKITDTPLSIRYTGADGQPYTSNLTFSLVSPIQNATPSETVEHIRQTAPSTYYTQNRMVNGQDYNTFPLKDSSIIKLKTVNRTFAGQPKFIDWNDASTRYQTVKLFGDDLLLKKELYFGMVETPVSSRSLIDRVVEPLLSDNSLLTTITDVCNHQAFADNIVSYPRRYFIEDHRQGVLLLDGTPVYNDDPVIAGKLCEKTRIQGVLDQHWYGEAIDYITESDTTYAVVDATSLSDAKIWAPDIPRKVATTQNTYEDYVIGDVGSGQPSTQVQIAFGLRYHRFIQKRGTVAISTLQSSSSIVETITIEKTSDIATFTVRSSVRGNLPDYNLQTGGAYNIQNPSTDISFTLQGSAFEGDAFILDVNGISINERTELIGGVNLLGAWDIMRFDQLPSGMFTDGAQDGPNDISAQIQSNNPESPHSWIVLIAPNITPSGDISSTFVYYRQQQYIVTSPTTNFWFNTTSKILNPETQTVVRDNIKILKSNITPSGSILQNAHSYDVVSNVKATNGTIDFHSLAVVPHGTEFTLNNDTPQNILQFDKLVEDSVAFKLIHTATLNTISEDISEFLTKQGNILLSTHPLLYGTLSKNTDTDNLYTSSTHPDYAVISYQCYTTNLDFMWSHYTPDTHLLDPSTTNIHDMFLLTKGYFTDYMRYVNNQTTEEPSPPSPLDLRTSYGYLLENKMLSDTVVLQPAKIKLLFGDKADKTLRARFKVVKRPTSQIPNQKLKTDIASVIAEFFAIDKWNFGQGFYATELIAKIHESLDTHIASVVIVPMYSGSNFGDLFSIECGTDEILQSCASAADVEIVDTLTPSNIRKF